MRRVGNVYLESLYREPEPLPDMRTHAEWCRWLLTHNSLDIKHRRCLETTRCVASAFKKTDIEWRRQSHAG